MLPLCYFARYDILHTAATVHGFDDKEEWGATLSALAAAGVAEEEVVNGVVAMLVACLNVGNLDFDPATGAVVDKALLQDICEVTRNSNTRRGQSTRRG